ncbi:hypothetical protein PV08_08245 [Exophiala spinifera]|uniref:Nucleoside phosphorylase domain-containing protein n=1 Tax=Exophiala spinifera TaxID=91928 RepID=A0A0D2B2E5_9EURO|nr:uncharacterized protein PV08_08245 [Exophiala spinifera]KIW13058.1 hypothetical protein PV08_08245 [Exophiala spinifera]
MTSQRPPNHEFSVAIFCALPPEADSIIAAFDVEWTGRIEKADGDTNSYSCGRIADHNCVVAHLSGVGKSNATLVAAGASATFKDIQYAFVVGICGGMPFDEKGKEILLGDVIISRALVQYDLGKQYPQGFKRKQEIEDVLPRPSHEVRALLAKLETLRGRQVIEQNTLEHLKAIQEQLPSASCPDPETDVLFDPSYFHQHRHVKGLSRCPFCQSKPQQFCQEASTTECEELGCKFTNATRRRALQPYHDGSTESSSRNPRIHIGRIGSADTVLKSGQFRNQLAKDEKLIGFEMEGVGIWDVFQNSLIVKAVCDYADSHKDKVWQDYAAASAAACLKSLLAELNPPRKAREHGNPESPLWSMPFEKSNLPDLVGRDDLLQNVQSKMFQPGKHSRIALLGLGGIGKSRVAMEVAYRMREARPKCSIFWVQATDARAFDNDCLMLGKLLNIPGIEDSKSDPKDLVCAHLSKSFAGEWLFILDNADDAKLWGGTGTSTTATEATFSSLVEYLPRSETGSILITTRNRRVASPIAKENVFMVSDMDTKDAETVLRNLLEKEELLNDRKSTEELLEILTCLPLAIVQAAAYINKNEETIKTYVRLLQQPEDDMIRLLSEDFSDEGRYKTSLNPVATTWLVSFQQILYESPVAAEYLEMASCLSEKNIPGSFFTAPSEIDKIDALGVLKGYSFFREHDERNINDSVGLLYDMHRLVRLATRNWLKRRKEMSTCLKSAFQRMVFVFPEVTWETKDIWMLYMPHAQVLCDFTEGEDLFERYVLLQKMASCLGWKGQVNASIKLLKVVVDWAENALDADDYFKWQTIWGLGIYLLDVGRESESELYIDRALQWGIEHRGKNDEFTLGCMVGVGGHKVQQGFWKEAEALLQEAIEVGKRITGPENANVQQARLDLAEIYMGTDRQDEAERIATELLEIEKRLRGERNHPNILNLMAFLSRIYRLQGRHGEAEQLSLEVVRKLEQFCGPTNAHTLKALVELALAYLCRGKLQEAEEAALRSLQGCRLLQHVNSGWIRECMSGLAHIFWRQGRHEDAIKMMDERVKIDEELEHTHHPWAQYCVQTLLKWRNWMRERDARDDPSGSVTHRLEGSREEGMLQGPSDEQSVRGFEDLDISERQQTHRQTQRHSQRSLKRRLSSRSPTRSGRRRHNHKSGSPD